MHVCIRACVLKRFSHVCDSRGRMTDKYPGEKQGEALNTPRQKCLSFLKTVAPSMARLPEDRGEHEEV